MPSVSLANSLATGVQIKTSGTTLSFASTSWTAGQAIVVAFAYDNLTATTPTASFNKPAGETNNWIVEEWDAQTASAGGGLRGGIAYILTTTAWNSFVITMTLSASVTSKAMTYATFNNVSGFQSGGGQANVSAALNASSFFGVENGDAFVSAWGRESATLSTGYTFSPTQSLTGKNGISTTGGNAATNINVALAYAYNLSGVGGGTDITVSDNTNPTVDNFVSAITLRQTASATNQTVTPAGIASTEAFGTAVRTSAITSSPTEIATGEAVGTHTATITPPTQTISPTEWLDSTIIPPPVIINTTVISSPPGVASSEAFGTPVRTSSLTATPTGAGTGEAFGNPTRTSTVTASPSGIVDPTAYGNPILTTAVTIAPTALADSSAYGTPTVTNAPLVTTVNPTAISDPTAFGTLIVTPTISASPVGISTAEVFGVPTRTSSITLFPTSIVSTEAVGTPVLTATITVTTVGIGTLENFGSVLANVIWTLAPPAVASLEAAGTPSISTAITSSPTGISSAQAFGVPVRTSSITSSPTGIASGETLGAGASFSDDYNRTDSASLGPNWVSIEASGSTAGIVSNQLKNGNVSQQVRWVTPVQAGNQFSQITVVGSNNVGPCVAINGFAAGDGRATGQGYYFNKTSTGTTLAKRSGGSAVSLHTQTAVVPVAGDVLRLEYDGTTLRGFVNGVQVSTAIDTTLAANSYVGLELAGGFNIAVADDWSGGTLTSGGPVVSPTVTLVPNGIASLEAAGTPLLAATVVVAPVALGSFEAAGTPVLAPTITVAPVGIASAQALGVPVIAASVTVAPVGIASAELFGVASTGNVLIVAPTAVASLEAFGLLTRTSTVTSSPAGIISAQSVGTVAVTRNIAVSPTGIVTTEVLGVLVITTAVVISPTGIITREAFETPVQISSIILGPFGVDSLELLGYLALDGFGVQPTYTGWGIPLGF